MDIILQAVINGLATGSVYGLLALGYTTIYATTRVVNFAQGEFLMVGALFGWLFYQSLKLPYIVTIVLVIIVCAIVGFVSEKMIMEPYKKSGAGFTWIITTMAVAIVLRNLFAIPFGTEAFNVKPAINGRLSVGPTSVSYQQIFVVIAMLVILVIFQTFQSKTFWGIAMRAAAFNTDVTSLMGIPVPRLISLSFIVSSVITGVAGVLVAPLTFADANMGAALGMKGFVCLVVGGLGSPIGAVLGGLLIGMLESLSRSLLPAALANISIYVMLVVVLILKPRGLFNLTGSAKKSAKKKEDET